MGKKVINIDNLTENGKRICEWNRITTNEELEWIIKSIKLDMRLDYGIKATIYNKMSASEILEWMVQKNIEEGPIMGS